MIYTVRAKSALFCEYYRELDIKELYKMASSSIKNAVAFLCGFYEAEGCFSDRERRTKSGKSTYHDWSIEIINADLALLLLCKRLLSEYLCIARSNIRWRRTAYVLSLYGRDQILHFLASLQPCIKNGGD